MGYQGAQQHTLVIGDADGHDGEEPGPRPGGGNCVNHIVHLGRDVGADIFRVGEDRRQDGGRPGGIECVHGGQREKKLVFLWWALLIASSRCLSRTHDILLFVVAVPSLTVPGEERTDGGKRGDGDGDIKELRVDRGGRKQKGAGPGPSGV